ncbi:hypothetical protein QG37_08012 [Candidozyma auris]|nr:hypothetical protein QG37_08012 [[Candida] auris]
MYHDIQGENANIINAKRAKCWQRYREKKIQMVIIINNARGRGRRRDERSSSASSSAKSAT